MIISLFGANCTGKSTVATYLSDKLNAKVYSGKDYLKLAKSKSEAMVIFKNMLSESSDDIIYVVTEIDDLNLLPKNAFKVLFTADLNTIKKRFAERINASFSIQIENMLKRKQELCSKQTYDLLVNSDTSTVLEITNQILTSLNKVSF